VKPGKLITERRRPDPQPPIHLKRALGYECVERREEDNAVSDSRERESLYTSVRPNCDSSDCSDVGTGVDVLFYINLDFSFYDEVYLIKESSIPESASAKNACHQRATSYAV
jgi:hypothetical protein